MNTKPTIYARSSPRRRSTPRRSPAERLRQQPSGSRSAVLLAPEPELEADGAFNGGHVFSKAVGVPGNLGWHGRGDFRVVLDQLRDPARTRLATRARSSVPYGAG